MKTDRKYIYRLVSLLFVVSVFISACGDENSNPAQSNTSTQKVVALTADHPIHYVSKEMTCAGHNPCSTSIQDAINNASAGDRVHVLAGTYNEGIVLKSGVTVQGAGAQATAIDATGKGSAVIAQNLNPMVPGNETTIDALTIKGGSNYRGGGFYIFNSSITMTNLVITGNRADYGGGVYIYSNSSPVISNTVIKGNTATVGGGIYNGYLSTPVVANTTITGNSASFNFAAGIKSNTDALLKIQNSIVVANFGAGLSGKIISDYNNIWGNTLGDYSSGATPGANDISADPMFVDAAVGDYRLQAVSPCIDTGSNSAVTAGLMKDIYGKSRISDGNLDGAAAVDMGVAEYHLVSVTAPLNDAALQGMVTVEATALGADTLEFFVREPGGPNGVPIGFENLTASFDVAAGSWKHTLASTPLLDGYYIVFATARNSAGHEVTSDAVSFSIRNWNLIATTLTGKAGKVLPVKFVLRVSQAVDPLQPFVHNEGLAVKIYMATNPEVILQTSYYGFRDTDYRINDKEQLYITNFRTERIPAEYTVEIVRAGLLIGKFTLKSV